MRLSATRACAALASIALASLAFDQNAAAQVKLRVGKAQAQTFAFAPADVGVEAGIFKKHGLDVEISNFGGDAKLLQALSADAIDIAVGGGPPFAFIVKGAPMLAVGALADAPGTIMLVVAKDGPVKTEDDLKGRTVSVSTTAQAAALKTRQIDGVITETSSVFRLEEEGSGRILVRFGERIKDFHVHVIYASKALIDKNPEAVRAYLAAWYETVAYMRDHKDQTIDIAARVSEVSKAVATRNYDELMPIFNATGRFNPKALDVLSRSFVESGALPARPDMSTLYTEQFLPKKEWQLR